MSHSEEILRRLIRKLIKDRGRCKRSNDINGNSGQIAKEQTMCRSYRAIQHVRKKGLNLTKILNPFLLNPPALKFYITHHKLITIANLVDILCTNEYINHKS